MDTGRLSKIQIFNFIDKLYSSVVLSTFILDRNIRAIFFKAQTHAYSKAGVGGGGGGGGTGGLFMIAIF